MAQTNASLALAQRLTLQATQEARLSALEKRMSPAASARSSAVLFPVVFGLLGVIAGSWLSRRGGRR